MTLLLEDFLLSENSKQKGWTITAITRETGFDRKTIRKYLEAEAACTTSKKRAIDSYKAYLLERNKEGNNLCSSNRRNSSERLRRNKHHSSRICPPLTGGDEETSTCTI